MRGRKKEEIGEVVKSCQKEEKKMITLTRNQSELSIVACQCRCEVCKGLIISGDRFYKVTYKLDVLKQEPVLITKLYHFNCVQRGQAMSPEAKDIDKKLSSVIAEREAAEQELEESEQSLSDLIAQESLLRRKLGEVHVAR